MGNKPKTRFYAVIDGRDVQLFSVRDRGNGNGILLAATASDTLDIGNIGTDLPVREQHYSIHPSEGGRHTTVTQKTLLESGDIYSEMAKISDTETHLLWPVFAKRCHTYNAENRQLPHRDKDMLIKVADYKSDTSTLLFSVFVSKPDTIPKDFHLKANNIRTQRCGEYDVTVISTYLHVPTWHEGDIVGHATSPGVMNKEFEPTHEQKPTTSLSAGQVEVAHNYMVIRLWQALMIRTRGDLSEWGDLGGFFLQMASMIHDAPYEDRIKRID